MIPAEWREWSQRAAEADARMGGFGLALHRRIVELHTDAGSCFAALRTLARSVGCCERTARRWLRKLEAWGYVLRLDRFWQSGMRRSHVLVPVAPVAPHVQELLKKSAGDHAQRCSESWRPRWGLRTAPPAPALASACKVVSRADTPRNVNESLHDGWGTSSGPGPGDAGWSAPKKPRSKREWKPREKWRLPKATARRIHEQLGPLIEWLREQNAAPVRAVGEA